MNTEKDMLTIRKSNTELYNYFNSRYKECSERLQKNQASLFEINIRLEELERTKNAYISTNNARKNLFSPLPLSKEESEKEASLEEEITKLRAAKRELQNKISEDEASQKFFNRKLKSAKHSLESLEELSGIKQPAIARIEKGVNSPTVETLIRLLAPLGKKLAVVPMNSSAGT